jgi:hypothetical protein
LPEIGVNELTGSVDKYKDFYAALEKTSPVTVGFEKITSGAKGYYHQEDKRIAINEGMSELQTLKTAIHEIAHSRLHAIDKNAPITEPRPDRRTREIEAESIAYTVCQHYGLDTSDYSFGYVATWSGDKQLDALKSSLDTIRKEADAIITEVDKHFAELTQGKEQTAEQAAPEQTAPVGGDSPEIQKAKQGLDGEVKTTLQFFIDRDIEDNGAIRAATLEMIAVQGYELRDGKLEVAPPMSGTFTIYQIKDGDDTRDICFEPLDSLKQAPDAANYNTVYTAPLKHGDTLDRIYMQFNLDRPQDFTGHSLSVSDIVVMNRDGQETAYYVDSAGFKELPGFLAEKAQKQEKPVDLTAAAAYMQKLNDALQAVKPDSAMSEAAYSATIKRLEQANGRIPDEHPQLKALITNAAQSPDFNTLKERMSTLNTEFTQHYSTAVQMTIDGGGKAEPPTAAASVKQTEPAPAQKPPAQGENVAAIEARVNAGEVINISDLTDAMKKDKQAAQTSQTGKTNAPTPAKSGTRGTAKKGDWKAAQAQDSWDRAAQGKGTTKPAEQKPSIREELAAGKKQLAGQKSAPSKAQNKNAEIGG